MTAGCWLTAGADTMSFFIIYINAFSAAVLLLPVSLPSGGLLTCNPSGVRPCPSPHSSRSSQQQLVIVPQKSGSAPLRSQALSVSLHSGDYHRHVDRWLSPLRSPSLFVSSLFRVQPRQLVIAPQESGSVSCPASSEHHFLINTYLILT